jgi:gliding motility-associated protein GldM
MISGDGVMMGYAFPVRVEAVKPSEHNPTGDWNIGYFEHMPTVAAIAMFSKFQNDIRSSEALVIAKLYEEAHLKDVKFDTLAAVAVPKTSYALAGDKIEASILLAAFNKGNKPTVNISQGGGTKKEPVNGVVPWETIATGTGLQTVKGTITLNNGEEQIVRNWQFEYMVGTTGASLQLDKMNVFYIGVPNPVTVAAAGYSVEDVSLAVPNSRAEPDAEKGKGHYNIFVDKVGTVDVAINAKTKEGPIKQVGKMNVRIKRIPDPVAEINKVSSGGMSASIFRAQIAPAAVLKDFEFDAKFQIISFSFLMLPKGKDIVGPYDVKSQTGCRFDQNSDVAKAIKMAKAGDRIFIEEIKAVGPDKVPRKLNSITLSLN